MKIRPRARRRTIWVIRRILLFEKAIQIALEEVVVVPETPRLLLELVSHDDGRRLVDLGAHAAIDIALNFADDGGIVGQRLNSLLLFRREGGGDGLPDLPVHAPWGLRLKERVADLTVLAQARGGGGEIRAGAE